jgi:hypothetical protein
MSFFPPPQPGHARSKSANATAFATCIWGARPCKARCAERSVALELEYTRGMMAFLLFQRMPRDIALIGLGGGSLAKYIHRHLPDSRLTALEINRKWSPPPAPISCCRP